MRPVELPENSDPTGIHASNITGDVSFIALGDMISGNKIDITNTIIQISVEAVTQRPLNTISPYRRLVPFRVEEKDLFFGRDQLVKELLVELSHSNVMFLLGASGSGKSSVIRAGLIPSLSVLVGARFRYFILVPDVNPFQALSGSIQAAGFDQESASKIAAAQPNALLNLLRDLQRPEEQWLIFVDQFEEIFARTETRLKDAFMAALLKIVKESDGSIKLVLAMQADFLDRFEPYQDVAKSIEKRIHLVTNMHVDELRLAIEQPAGCHGVVFEPGLVEEIIKDVDGQPGSLPLLQYTLDLLWEQERTSNGLVERHLRSHTYRELGGVRGALQQRAEQIYASIGDRREPKKISPKQEVMRHILLRLVDIAGKGADDPVWRSVRRRVPKSDFNTAEEQELLETLIKEKLLVSGGRNIEKRLIGTRENVEGRFGTFCLFDSVNGRKLRDLNIKHALKVNDVNLSPNEQLILTASDDGTAQLWTSTEGNPVGQPMTHGGPPLNTARFSPDGQWIVTAGADGTARIWRAKDGSQPGNSNIMRHTRNVHSAEFSSDSKRILTASSDLTARLWEVPTCDEVSAVMRVAPLDVESRMLGARFSQSNEFILTWTDFYTAQVWNGINGRNIVESITHIHEKMVGPQGLEAPGDFHITSQDPYSGETTDMGIKTADFALGGKAILTLGFADNHIRVCNSTNGSLIAVLNHSSPVAGETVSPNGKLVLSWCENNTARLWSLDKGRCIGIFSLQASISAAAFDTTGKHSLICDDAGDTALWDIGMSEDVSTEERILSFEISCSTKLEGTEPGYLTPQELEECKQRLSHLRQTLLAKPRGN